MDETSLHVKNLICIYNSHGLNSILCFNSNICFKNKPPNIHLDILYPRVYIEKIADFYYRNSDRIEVSISNRFRTILICCNAFQVLYQVDRCECLSSLLALQRLRIVEEIEKVTDNDSRLKKRKEKAICPKLHDARHRLPKVNINQKKKKKQQK